MTMFREFYRDKDGPDGNGGSNSQPTEKPNGGDEKPVVVVAHPGEGKQPQKLGEPTPNSAVLYST